MESTPLADEFFRKLASVSPRAVDSCVLNHGEEPDEATQAGIENIVRTALLCTDMLTVKDVPSDDGLCGGVAEMLLRSKLFTDQSNTDRSSGDYDTRVAYYDSVAVQVGSGVETVLVAAEKLLKIHEKSPD